MNSAPSATATASLLFHWEAPRSRRLAITFFLIGSVVAHLLCFYVFQVVYPPTVARLPPPARVSLITARSEEGRSLLQWIESEDPALAFIPQRPPEARVRALPKTSHVPSYVTREPVLKKTPPLVVDLEAPVAQSPGAVPTVRRPVANAGLALATTISLSDELDLRGHPVLPERKFAASNNESPQNVQFRVAVGASGEVRFCFPLNSSGDPALDEQARQYLMRCRFPSSASGKGGGHELVWGLATIEWGNDIARPPSSATSSPAP